jgi:hypothetical protein
MPGSPVTEETTSRPRPSPPSVHESLVVENIGSELMAQLLEGLVLPKADLEEEPEIAQPPQPSSDEVPRTRQSRVTPALETRGKSLARLAMVQNAGIHQHSQRTTRQTAIRSASETPSTSTQDSPQPVRVKREDGSYLPHRAVSTWAAADNTPIVNRPSTRALAKRTREIEESAKKGSSAKRRATGRGVKAADVGTKTKTPSRSRASIPQHPTSAKAGTTSDTARGSDTPVSRRGGSARVSQQSPEPGTSLVDSDLNSDGTPKQRSATWDALQGIWSDRNFSTTTNGHFRSAHTPIPMVPIEEMLGAQMSTATVPGHGMISRQAHYEVTSNASDDLSMAAEGNIRMATNQAFPSAQTTSATMPSTTMMHLQSAENLVDGMMTLAQMPTSMGPGQAMFGRAMPTHMIPRDRMIAGLGVNPTASNSMLIGPRRMTAPTSGSTIPPPFNFQQNVFTMNREMTPHSRLPSGSRIHTFPERSPTPSTADAFGSNAPTGPLGTFDQWRAYGSTSFYHGLAPQPSPSHFPSVQQAPIAPMAGIGASVSVSNGAGPTSQNGWQGNPSTEHTAPSAPTFLASMQVTHPGPGTDPNANRRTLTDREVRRHLDG